MSSVTMVCFTMSCRVREGQGAKCNELAARSQRRSFSGCPDETSGLAEGEERGRGVPGSRCRPALAVRVHPLRFPAFARAGGGQGEQHEGYHDPGQRIRSEPWQGGGQTCGVKGHGGFRMWRCPRYGVRRRPLEHFPRGRSARPRAAPSHAPAGFRCRSPRRRRAGWPAWPSADARLTARRARRSRPSDVSGRCARPGSRRGAGC